MSGAEYSVAGVHYAGRLEQKCADDTDYVLSNTADL